MAKVRDFEMPDDLYYHKEFCWVKKESDELVRVGLIDFAQSEAGDITYIDLPFEGDEVEQNEPCGKIQSAKWIGKLVAPVTGEVVEVNYDLESDATLINQDCYGAGWIITVQPSDLDADMANLMQGQAAHQWLEKEIDEVEKGKAEGKDYAAE
jgi:glycine cleavage system H protein